MGKLQAPTTQVVHGMEISVDPDEWEDDEVLWLAQWDDPQVRDDVRKQAEARNIQLPGQSAILATVKAGVAEVGKPCPTCGQVVPEPQSEVVVGSYNELTKEDLQNELDNRGIAYSTHETKAELVAKLDADDEENQG